MKLRIFGVLFLVLAFVVPTQSFANSSRDKNKFGIYVALLGDPFPSLTGFNAAYNFSQAIRAHVGYGNVSSGSISLTTIGAGAKYLFMNSNFSPALGANWAQVSLSGAGTLNGFSSTGSHFYLTGSLDWTTDGGFNFGAGYNYSLTNGVGGAPFIQLGWFF